MATGYVTDESVGTVHVVAVEHAAVGIVAAVAREVLPLSESAVVGRRMVPVVNCVDEAVTFQPAPLPVASSTTIVSCPVVVSSTPWSTPVSVAAHVNTVGGVKVRDPAVKVSVPISVHGVVTATAPEHAAA
jgi:hypothetical protein